MRNKIKEYLRLKFFRLMHRKKVNYVGEHDKKIFSQLGEDGFIMYLFEKIGTTNKRFVEIGIGDGSECNTRNLIENLGWGGWMVDGNEEKASKAAKRFKNFPVKVFDKFITRGNINFLDMNDLDLLSIDIDGNDFWIWDYLKTNPRVVIIEYNCSFGEKSITIPPTDTPRLETFPDLLYHGASLKAMVKLGHSKGYKLVYANGTNAIFVRRDIKKIEELRYGETPEDYNRRRWGSPDEQFELIKDKEFVRV